MAKTYRTILEDLHTTGLLRRLGELAAQLMRDTDAKVTKTRTRWEPSRPFYLHEEYSRRTLLAAGELLSVCEQIALATAFLSGYRSRKLVTGDPITRFDYIVYHLENHLIRSTSVLDRSLLLTNTVFRLGLAEEDCRFRTVTNNEHVKPAGKVKDALKGLDGLLNSMRRLRNVVVHRRKHSEEEFEMIEQYYVLQKIEQKHNTAWSYTKQYYVPFKTMTDQLVSAKKAALADTNVKVFEAVG